MRRRRKTPERSGSLKKEKRGSIFASLVQSYLGVPLKHGQREVGRWNAIQ